MKTLTRTTRLISATTAAATTLVLFSAVFANAEPQRSVLMAKTQRLEKLASAPITVVAPVAPITVVLASNGAATDGR